MRSSLARQATSVRRPRARSLPPADACSQTDIDSAGLEATAAGIRAVHGAKSVATRVADLVDPDAAETVVTAAVAEYGGLDIVVHAAVDHERGRIEALTPEKWNRAYALNVGAVAWLVRAAHPHLERSGGTVVLFSSVQAHGGIPGCSLYGSTQGRDRPNAGVTQRRSSRRTIDRYCSLS